MRPIVRSPAHKTDNVAELVCSNSLRSAMIDHAAGLLKEELRLLGSLIMEAADATAIPAGKALAVDRILFSRWIEKRLSAFSNLEIIREEVFKLPPDDVTICASGPLTSDTLAESIAEMTGEQHLSFYDAISPIIDADSIDFEKVFQASRYENGEGDYLNCPFTTAEQYFHFYREMLDGKEVPLRDYEDVRYFEGCLPVEVMAKRGPQTLLFGPMKPVGLKDPKTGKTPYAVVQLRRENREATAYNLVGFQTKLTWKEQSRIFRMIPGLEHAEFLRYGSIHRNTFINAPVLLNQTLQLRSHENIFFSGQITGVEGYIESAAMGLLAGIFAKRMLNGQTIIPAPEVTAMGALLRHVAHSDAVNFQPMNINFGIFPPLEKRVPRKERGRLYAQRALTALHIWKDELNN